jgi:hypothetical protein
MRQARRKCCKGMTYMALRAKREPTTLFSRQQRSNLRIFLHIPILRVMSTRNRFKAEVPISSLPQASSSSSPLSPNGTMNSLKKAPSSPWYPTFLESILLAIYPFTLVLGSTFSVLNSKTRNTPYSGDLQSHPPGLAPSYFALKSNVFNVYFVKIGWVWITGAFFLFCFTHSSLGPRFQPTLTPRRIRAIIRYTMVTAVWCAVTQWLSTTTSKIR